jgi:uncharacterized protein GlcG (DUF336 family)
MEVVMSGIVKALGALAVASLLSVQAHAQALTQKNVSEAMALTIASAALEKCQSMTYKVSVVVIDRDGLQVVMLRGDGAGLHTPEGADRKAYTARTYGSPSENFAKRVQTDTAYAPAMQYTRVLALGGGLPIKVGNEVIGAVGVSTSAAKPASTRWPIS